MSYLHISVIYIIIIFEFVCCVRLLVFILPNVITDLLCCVYVNLLAVEVRPPVAVMLYKLYNCSNAPQVYLISDKRKRTEERRQFGV